MSSRTAAAQPVKARTSTHSSNDDYDIISKRSVERLYHPSEPSYLRHFVKKPVKRSALTHRCYWLRLKAVEVIVRLFLQRPSGRKKVIIDLGCGSDALPWKCKLRYPEACKDALFVHVQKRSVLLRKRDVVLKAPPILELLGSDVHVAESQDDPVLLRSPNYCQLVCEARESSDIEALAVAMNSVLPLPANEIEVLFVGELSSLYLNPSLLDDVLRWAKSLNKAEVCLFEPAVEGSEDLPFTKALTEKFAKLGTDNKKYLAISEQIMRFQSTGWNQVRACNLWEVWENEAFVTSEERQAMDKVEPFDEWEDFLLWCQHFCLLHASTYECESALRKWNRSAPSSQDGVLVDLRRQRERKEIKRRFGGVAYLDDFDGRRSAMHLFGSNGDQCLDTYDLYAYGDVGPDISGPHLPKNKVPLEGPSSRMSFTLTDLGDYGYLLAGGRKASGKVCADCWILKKGPVPSWERIGDLPVPVFRHSTVRLKGTSTALLLAGKTSSAELLQGAFVYHPEKGWLKCIINEPDSFDHASRFGATVVCSEPESAGNGLFSGLVFGGLCQHGSLKRGVQQWTLSMRGTEPTLSFNTDMLVDDPGERLSVVGAQAVEKDGNVIICGGAGAKPVNPGHALSWICSDSKNEDGSASCNTKVKELVYNDRLSTPPLMIGHTIAFDGKSITIFGGGALYFEADGAWHTTTDQLDWECPKLAGDLSHRVREQSFIYKETPKMLPHTGKHTSTQATNASATITEIPRRKLYAKDDFARYLSEGKPIIIEDVNIGGCVDRWHPEYISEKVGHKQQVIVHECEGTEKMDFNSKNFRYVTDTMANIMSRIEAGGRLYLRSLSASKPSEAPAKLEEDFPDLSGDFVLPGELEFVRENLFSSVLRISGRVNMWLHYDVMANIYTQIRGTKRMILFPPSDVSHLSFAPGASSSSLDVFSSLDGQALSQTRPHEAHLRPGDILLIPPMWFHTATPTSDMSVAVNVFFRDLQDGYSGGRDVYGNRDLAAYEKARQDAARIGKSFERLPGEIRKFYLARLADELRAMGEDD